jgi:Family of unknown function (DUF6504)
MAHRYGQPVPVTLAGDQPSSCEWHGAHYHVAEVLATWHLRDRWWARGSAAVAASDRHYYRVRCADEQVFDLYHDVERALWALDRAHD